jgi:GntR family transcriptional regulator, phosphonate transport system regulatory protein
MDVSLKKVCVDFMTKFFALAAHIGLLPSPGHSFWARVAHEIANAIGKGIYGPGERLPSEHDLAEIHGVNRHTIRRSLSSLGQMGLVRSTKGSGTFVEELAVDLVLGKRTRHQHSLAQAGIKGGLQLLSTTRERADAGTARALALRVGSAVLHLVVLGDGDGQALHVSDRYFPLPRFAGLDVHLQETASISQSFTRLGVADYTRQQSRISACLPRAEVADHLSQASTRPVLQVTSVNVDAIGIPIEYARTWFAGDRVTLTVEHAHAG